METIIERLAQQGLQLATTEEQGWYWKDFNEDGELITLWVTDI